MAKKQYPHEQGFQTRGNKNLTKKNSWWAKPPFHNNAVNRRGSKNEQG